MDQTPMEQISAFKEDAKANYIQEMIDKGYPGLESASDFTSIDIIAKAKQGNPVISVLVQGYYRYEDDSGDPKNVRTDKRTYIGNVNWFGETSS